MTNFTEGYTEDYSLDTLLLKDYSAEDVGEYQVLEDEGVIYIMIAQYEEDNVVLSVTPVSYSEDTGIFSSLAEKYVAPLLPAEASKEATAYFVQTNFRGIVRHAFTELLKEVQ